MRARGWVALVLAVGCGDGQARDEVLTAHGGRRLALSWYRYPDGTEQPEPGELYDRALHTRCAPARWTDAVERCVPVADDAVFTDAACTTVVGVATTLDEPTHFLGHELIDGQVVATRVYVAGDEVAPVAQFYWRSDEGCLGPFTTDPDATYVAVTGEVAGGDLARLTDVEVGAGRLALVARTSDDGLWAPIGVRDRALDVACTPVPRPDGTAACEPEGAVTAAYFQDPACSAPVVAVDAGAPAPRVARVDEPSGCPGFRAVGDPIAGALYRKDGAACRAATAPPASQAFAVGEPLAVPTLARTVDAAPGRRLAPAVLDGDGLRFDDQRLVDRALRGDCVRHRFADDVTRCIPAATAPALRVFTATCVVAVPVVELPVRACDRPAFAAGTGEAGFELRAIGDPVTEPLFTWIDDRCRAYTPTPGTVAYRLGPPIDPTAFAGAVLFGER